MTAEILFCIKYLKDHGVNAQNLWEYDTAIERFDTSNFTIVKLRDAPISEQFFEDLAKGLRSLWPPGDKDNKYPWRDSVKNLKMRLQALWEERRLNNYTLDECLAVARRYLAQFENDTKYMKLLKYYIWKQKKLVSSDGSVTYTYESQFADMLEGKSDIDAIENEWASMLTDVSIGEGDLI